MSIRVEGSWNRKLNQSNEWAKGMLEIELNTQKKQVTHPILKMSPWSWFNDPVGLAA